MKFGHFAVFQDGQIPVAQVNGRQPVEPSRRDAHPCTPPEPAQVPARIRIVADRLVDSAHARGPRAGVDQRIVRGEVVTQDEDGRQRQRMPRQQLPEYPPPECPQRTPMPRAVELRKCGHGRVSIRSIPLGFGMTLKPSSPLRSRSPRSDYPPVHYWTPRSRSHRCDACPPPWRPAHAT